MLGGEDGVDREPLDPLGLLRVASRLLRTLAAQALEQSARDDERSADDDGGIAESCASFSSSSIRCFSRASRSSARWRARPEFIRGCLPASSCSLSSFARWSQ